MLHRMPKLKQNDEKTCLYDDILHNRQSNLVRDTERKGKSSHDIANFVFALGNNSGKHHYH